MKWHLVNLTGQKSTVAKDLNGNTIVVTAPSIAIFAPTHFGQHFGQQLLLYRSGDGMFAYLTGRDGESVTDQLPQERWEEIHSQALAGFVMLGRLPKIIIELALTN